MMGENNYTYEQIFGALAKLPEEERDILFYFMQMKEIYKIGNIKGYGREYTKYVGEIIKSLTKLNKAIVLYYKYLEQGV